MAWPWRTSLTMAGRLSPYSRAWRTRRSLKMGFLRLSRAYFDVRGLFGGRHVAIAGDMLQDVGLGDVQEPATVDFAGAQRVGQGRLIGDDAENQLVEVRQALLVVVGVAHFGDAIACLARHHPEWPAAHLRHEGELTGVDRLRA